MKTSIIKRLVSALSIAILLGTLATTAKASPIAVSGRIDAGGVVYDSADFLYISDIFEERYVEGARQLGAKDGAAGVTRTIPGIEYSYHDHTDASGNIITNDAYKATVSGGCYTVYHHDAVYKWQPCGGSLIINSSPKMQYDGKTGGMVQVGQNVWAECSRCGAHYDQSAYYAGRGCTGGQNVLTGYNDYYTCGCGHKAHEILSATIHYN